jgi:hypothetical protein
MVEPVELMVVAAVVDVINMDKVLLVAAVPFVLSGQAQSVHSHQTIQETYR